VTLTKYHSQRLRRFAYGLVSEDQISGRIGLSSRRVRFDIVAQLHPRLQRTAPVDAPGLLAERLKPLLDHEQRERSFLSAGSWKGVPSYSPRTGVGCCSGPDDPGPHRQQSDVDVQLASLLSRFERQTIIDKTGLIGLFDVNLQWTSERRRRRPARNHPFTQLRGTAWPEVEAQRSR